MTWEIWSVGVETLVDELGLKRGVEQLQIVVLTVQSMTIV